MLHRGREFISFSFFLSLIFENLVGSMQLDKGLENQSHTSYNSFLDFQSKFGGKVKNGKEGIIWFSVTWNICLHRNKIIFEGDNLNINLVLNHSKLFMWLWNCIDKISIPCCNYVDFITHPILYLNM